MTIKLNNVYIKNVATIAGLDEKNGTFGKYYDKTYDDYYHGEKTFEMAEIKSVIECSNLALKKANKKMNSIDVILGTDLSNQITANTYATVNLSKPYLGVYNACASVCEEIIIASCLIKTNKVNNVLINTSSHNMTAERQFRNPVEYGAPKPKRSTYTVTGAASCILSSDKSSIKVSSVSIGTPVDLGVTDANDMGSVMAPAAAKVLNDYFKDTKTHPKDYDLILTGDLGVYGKEILKEYMKKGYKINIDEQVEDAGSIIYDREKQSKVKAGGSGPCCIALVAYTDVFNKLKNGKYKKVLLVATGALMSPTMNNQKLSIPSIAHLVCLEARL